MQPTLTSEQIGRAIAFFRKQKGISQDQLAQVLGIPRSSVSQMENNGRELTFLELQKLLALFEVSFEEFVDGAKPVHKKVAFEVPNYNQKIKFSPEKFKQLFLYILQKCGNRPNVGETVLYKLLYFCDFDFFELYQKPLTGMKYKKMQFGPIPDQSLFNPVLKEMRAVGLVERVSKPYINATVQTRYVNFIEADLSVFGADTSRMIKVADSVIDRLAAMSARQIEEHSHGDYPWLSHKDNEEIDYSSVFSRSGEFANRDYEQEWMESAASDVLKELPPMSKKEYDYYMSLPD